VAEIYEQLGARIAGLRHTRKYTQESLAERADIAASYVAHLETGSKRPSLEVISRLAGALGVPMWRLIADDRLTGDEKAWDASSRALAAEVRGLPAAEIDLLVAIARRFRIATAPRRPAPRKRHRSPRATG
jgi:transcriptional regulator with XRE-family HTH domain